MPDEYGQLQQVERRGVLGKYSKLRQGLEAGFHKRGIQRSGFAGEALTGLGAEEQGALSQVQSGLTERLQQYKFQQQQLEYMKKMADAQQQQQDSGGGWLSSVLGFAGPIIGGLIGLSAERFKKDIEPFAGLDRLRPVTWTWKDRSGKGVGVIAEEVARHVPQAAVYEPNGRPLGVNYGLLTAMLLKDREALKNRIAMGV